MIKFKNLKKNADAPFPYHSIQVDIISQHVTMEEEWRWGRLETKISEISKQSLNTKLETKSLEYDSARKLYKKIARDTV